MVKASEFVKLYVGHFPYLKPAANISTTGRCHCIVGLVLYSRSEAKNKYLVPKALLCIPSENSESPKVEKRERFKFFKGKRYGSSKEVNYETPKEQKSERSACVYSSPLVDEPLPYYSTRDPVGLSSL